jgi:hypothetical protein
MMDVRISKNSKFQDYITVSSRKVFLGSLEENTQLMPKTVSDLQMNGKYMILINYVTD